MSDWQPAQWLPDWDIDAAELKACIERGEEFYLLDVRLPTEHAEGHIPGSAVVPLHELPERLDELDPTWNLIVYGHCGIRSAEATRMLRAVGFDRARNLIGGITAWAAQTGPASL